jgi:hypothetical protein
MAGDDSSLTGAARVLACVARLVRPDSWRIFDTAIVGISLMSASGAELPAVLLLV